MQSQTATQPAVRSAKLLPLIALAFVGVLSTGCNTISGAGKDIQSAGEKVETQADKANK